MNYIQYDHDKKSIFSIDMRDEKSKPRSELTQKGIKKFLKQGKKIAFLVNKKGYATGTVCNECGNIPRCEQCDVAIAVHQTESGDKMGLCHICRREYTISADCSQCGGVDTTTYGLGSQQVAERVEKTYNTEVTILENSAANSKRKIEKMQKQVQQAQVVVGTSLLSSEITGWSPDLFVIVHADIGLNVPDFQANWNNFSLLYDCFSQHDAEVFLVQTYNPEAESIRFACDLDLEGMQEFEEDYRKQYQYPPYSDMCVLLYKHEIEERLLSTTNKMFKELLYLKRSYEMDGLEIYTTPPMIYKMYGKYRFSIILKGKKLRQFMDIAYSKLNMHTRGFKVDREPQQLL